MGSRTKRRMVAPPDAARLAVAKHPEAEPIAVFAYGSNLVAEQMRHRCPSATRGAMPAQLPGWRLAFSGWSAGWGGAVATVERSKGSTVEGVVWWVR